MKTARVSLFGLCFAIFAAACTPATSGNPGTGGRDRHGGNWREHQLHRRSDRLRHRVREHRDRLQQLRRLRHPL